MIFPTCAEPEGSRCRHRAAAAWRTRERPDQGDVRGRRRGNALTVHQRHFMDDNDTDLSPEALAVAEPSIRPSTAMRWPP